MKAIWKLCVTVPLAVAILTGCTVVKEHVKLAPHKPPPGVARVEGTSVARVKVVVPPVSESVTKMFGMGALEQKTILEGTTLTEALRQAFASELTARGFVLEDGGGTMRFEVGAASFEQAPMRMFRWRKIVATLSGTLEVRKPDGAKIYTKEIEIRHDVDVPDQRMKKGLSVAFGGAVDDVVAKAFSDPEFINALLASAKP